ncbi:hypothetical protein [Actinospongicola halichondriae]|uniref:hypothetical protein n=1 Tax=Actinospongicola halichondriae TaxID=3236844 RepID=UPI003D5A679A
MDRFGDGAHSGTGPVADGDGVLGADDAFGRSLARWAAEATVDEAVQARVRSRWLRIQSEESASLAGTLLDLAEHGRPVVVDVGEHRLRGVLAGIGGDFVAMRTVRGQQVLVRTASIDVVRSEPGGVDVRGDRPPLLDLELDGVLGPVAAERPDVLVRTITGVTARGELRSAGTDVIRVRVDGDPPTPVWVPTAAIAILVIDP